MPAGLRKQAKTNQLVFHYFETSFTYHQHEMELSKMFYLLQFLFRDFRVHLEHAFCVLVCKKGATTGNMIHGSKDDPMKDNLR